MTQYAIGFPLRKSTFTYEIWRVSKPRKLVKFTKAEMPIIASKTKFKITLRHAKESEHKMNPVTFIIENDQSIPMACEAPFDCTVNCEKVKLEVFVEPIYVPEDYNSRFCELNFSEIGEDDEKLNEIPKRPNREKKMQIN